MGATGQRGSATTRGDPVEGRRAGSVLSPPTGGAYLRLASRPVTLTASGSSVGRVTPRGTTVLQPGSAKFHLSLAGAWTAAMLQRLDVSRSATSALVPGTFQAFGAGMATLLAFYLALSHAREVTHRAPWVDSVLMDPDALEDLHLQAARFRDALMHFGEKNERDVDFGPTAAEPSGPLDVRRPALRGAVVMAFGFEHGEAYLYAPIDKDTTKRGWARLSWAHMEHAARAIEAWTLDLLERWAEVEQCWAPYVEAHGRQLGSAAGARSRRSKPARTLADRTQDRRPTGEQGPGAPGPPRPTRA